MTVIIIIIIIIIIRVQSNLAKGRIDVLSAFAATDSFDRFYSISFISVLFSCLIRVIKYLLTYLLNECERSK